MKRNGQEIDVDVWEAFEQYTKTVEMDIGETEDDWGPWFDFFAHGWDAATEYIPDSQDRDD